jgi:hypothetical protein
VRSWASAVYTALEAAVMASLGMAITVFTPTVGAVSSAGRSPR